jgi:hypothetical protein
LGNDLVFRFCATPCFRFFGCGTKACEPGGLLSLGAQDYVQIRAAHANLRMRRERLDPHNASNRPPEAFARPARGLPQPEAGQHQLSKHV